MAIEPNEPTLEELRDRIIETAMWSGGLCSDDIGRDAVEVCEEAITAFGRKVAMMTGRMVVPGTWDLVSEDALKSLGLGDE